MTAERHSWGEPQRDDPRLTVRVCTKCGARKLTHHNGNRHWISFASAEGLAFHGEKTPPCFPRKVEVAA